MVAIAGRIARPQIFFHRHLFLITFGGKIKQGNGGTLHNPIVFWAIAFLFLFFTAGAFAETAPIFYESFDSLGSVLANSGTFNPVNSAFEAGVAGNALHTRGGEFVSYPIANVQNLKQGTIEFLFKTSSSSGLLELDSNGGWPANNDYVMCFAGNGAIWNEIGWAGQYSIAFSRNEWHHAALVWRCGQGNDGFFTIYADGKPAASGWQKCDYYNGLPENKLAFVQPLILSVGKSSFYGAGEAFFDELSIFNYVKTEAQIKQDYLQYIGGGIACFQDSDCGAAHYTGPTYCLGGDVYRDYNYSTCGNPGTPQAVCGNNVNAARVQQCASGCAGGACNAAKPQSTGNVKAAGRKLLVNGSEFKVKAVGYAPVPIGQNPEWGYDVTAAANSALWQRDFPLLRAMGANSMRTWGKVGSTEFLDAAWNNNSQPIRVIMGYWMGNSRDYTDAATRQAIIADFNAYVKKFNSHPAVLVWAIGNEENWFYANGDNAKHAAYFSLVNEMAKAAYQIEGSAYHPVAAVSLEMPGTITTVGNSPGGADDASIPYIDIWGINHYPGITFGSFFTDFAAKSSKPLMIAEYGIDSWNNVSGAEQEQAQADWDSALWREIAASNAAIGGSIMEYSDEWWKDYSGNVSAHDFGGYATSTHPDNYSNEEWWGIVRTEKASGADKATPRKAYYALRQEFGGTQTACFANSDCGTDGWIEGSSDCNDSGGRVQIYQNWRTYECSNPGTAQASCSQTDKRQMILDCGTATYGQWSTPFCNNGGNSERTRTVHKAACAYTDRCYYEDSNEIDSTICPQGCAEGKCIGMPLPSGEAWKPLLLYETFDSAANARANAWSFDGGPTTEVQGKIGNALYPGVGIPLLGLHGTDGFINSNQGTIEFWFKPDYTSGSFGVFEAGQIGAPDSIGVFVAKYLGKYPVVVMESRQSDNKLRQSWTKITEVKANEWNHVAIAWKCNQKGDYIKIYFNGKAGSTESGACKKMGLLGKQFQIGGTGYYEKRPMAFDDLRVYSYIRSSAQIAADYKYAGAFSQPALAEPRSYAAVKYTQQFSWQPNGFEKFQIQVAQDANFAKPTAVTGWLAATSATLANMWQTIVDLEKKDSDKILYWRVLGSNKTNSEYSNASAFSFAPLTPASLNCPVGPIPDSYAFGWNAGDYANYAQIEYSYEESFVHKTPVNITKLNPVPVLKQYATLISYETKNQGKKLYARVFAKDKYNRTSYTNTCEFTLKQPAAPALQCPTTAIADAYAFDWNKGDYSTVYLQMGYDANFKAKTFFQAYDASSPTEVKPYYSTLIAYENKTAAKALFARLYTIDKYNRTAYSNSCEFGLKTPVAPTLECPAEAVGSTYAFGWNNGDYQKFALQAGNDAAFGKSTFIQLRSNASPILLGRNYAVLGTLAKKSSGGKLYARLFASDKYNRTAYSNSCTFEVASVKVLDAGDWLSAGDYNVSPAGTGYGSKKSLKVSVAIEGWDASVFVGPDLTAAFEAGLPKNLQGAKISALVYTPASCGDKFINKYVNKNYLQIHLRNGIGATVFYGGAVLFRKAGWKLAQIDLSKNNVGDIAKVLIKIGIFGGCNADFFIDDFAIEKDGKAYLYNFE